MTKKNIELGALEELDDHEGVWLEYSDGTVVTPTEWDGDGWPYIEGSFRSPDDLRFARLTAYREVEEHPHGRIPELVPIEEGQNPVIRLVESRQVYEGHHARGRWDCDGSCVSVEGLQALADAEGFEVAQWGTPGTATPEEWAESITVERERQRQAGYTAEHDAEHGLTHLLTFAIDYIRRGKGIEAAALVAAALDLPAGTAPAPAHEWTDDELRGLPAVARQADRSSNSYGVDGRAILNHVRTVEGTPSRRTITAKEAEEVGRVALGTGGWSSYHLTSVGRSVAAYLGIEVTS